MKIDLSLIVITTINTLILYLFLRKKFFAPVTNFMSERKNRVEQDIKNAENNLAKSEELKTQYNTKLDNLHKEGKEIIELNKNKANKLSEEIVAEARVEASNIIGRAKQDIELQRDKAMSEIKEHIIELSILAAEKVIGSELNNDKHHELINDFIEKVGV